jgi:hypothetical protein
MCKSALCTLIVSIVTFSASSVAASEAVGGPIATESTIRAGREIAVESCTGCHIATRHQDFRPVVVPAVPSFEEIANRPGATARSLRQFFDQTHRHLNSTQNSVFYETADISDQEASEVIAYILTQKHMP